MPWIAPPKSQRQTEEQVAAFTEKIAQQNEFYRSRRDPYQKVMGWLLIDPDNEHRDYADRMHVNECLHAPRPKFRLASATPMRSASFLELAARIGEQRRQAPDGDGKTSRWKFGVRCSSVDTKGYRLIPAKSIKEHFRLHDVSKRELSATPRRF